MSLTYISNRIFAPSVGMRPWVTKTSNYTARVGDRIAADTTSGAFSITLPSNVAEFNEVTIFDPKYSWGTNALTVLPGSNLLEGLNQSLLCDAAGLEIKLRYETDYGWRIYTNSVGSGGAASGSGGDLIIPGQAVTGPAFSAYFGTQTSYPATTITKAIFNSVQYNIGNCYNTTTGVFQPTTPGYYLLTGSIRTNTTATVFTYFFKNNVQIAGGTLSPAVNTSSSVVSVVVEMNGTTDYCDMRVWGSVSFSNLADDPITGITNTFTGTLINATGNVVPPGTIISYATQAAIPAGWLVCNGANVLQADYPNLYQIIGTLYNPTPPTNYFTLPDLRGEFVRGWDDSRGVDSGRTLGSSQSDAIRNITGSFGGVYGATSNAYNWGFRPGSGTGPFSVPYSTNAYNKYNGVYYPSGGVGFDVNFNAASQVPTANENRPRNIALRYLIKY